MGTIFTTNEFQKEVLSKEITDLSGSKFFANLISAFLFFEIDRVENAIKETYTKENSTKIIEALNLIFTAVN